MRKIIGLLLAKTGNLLIALSRKIYLSSFLTQKNAFKREVGDSTNLDCGLDQQSLVFDVGGYEGQWASDIYSKFNCRIHIFEPVPAFAENIRKRFAKNKNITVHPFGLSDTTGEEIISLDADGSSTIKIKGPESKIRLEAITDFLKENNINRLDLMKINIEGGEYALLSSLISSGFINNIDNILVQFHDFFPQAKEKMNHIRQDLSATHRPVYQYQFVWEMWERRKNENI